MFQIPKLRSVTDELEFLVNLTFLDRNIDLLSKASQTDFSDHETQISEPSNYSKLAKLETQTRNDEIIKKGLFEKVRNHVTMFFWSTCWRLLMPTLEVENSLSTIIIFIQFTHWNSHLKSKPQKILFPGDNATKWFLISDRKFPVICLLHIQWNVTEWLPTQSDLWVLGKFLKLLNLFPFPFNLNTQVSC